MSKNALPKLFNLAALASMASLALACTQSRYSPTELPPDRTPKGTVIESPGALAAKTPNWFTKDPEADGVEGVGADRAYIELGLKVGVEPIIVAVIDSGVDVNHEDLKDRMWVNADEIPGNGLDDDKNGFVDDIHGWNFLGSLDKSGKPTHVHATTLEVTRELVRMKALKAEKEAKGEELSADEKAYLAEVSKEVSAGLEDAQKRFDFYSAVDAKLKPQYEILKTLLGVPYDQVTTPMVTALKPTDPAEIAAQTEMLKVLNEYKVPTIARLLRVINAASDSIKYHFNESFDPRKEIIGDDLNNFDDIAYGNNDVTGPDSFHGTHVSGIIGATRDNNLGIQGVAQDVRIMALRAVPNGDEYDKDVANAVRYAVNNGARVINMSFGKAYSSVNKSKVDQAFAYAAAKGVVIVHSAGNDAKQNTPFNNFPNKYVKASPGTLIANWIEVGASTPSRNADLPAVFSNWGKETVDIFAPGFQVVSTVPGNGYGAASGTSMAGPCVAGVAALILSQYPEMNGATVRDLIRQNARRHAQLEVKNPGDAVMVLFSSLSSTGGVADVLASLRRALTL